MTLTVRSVNTEFACVGSADKKTKPLTSETNTNKDASDGLLIKAFAAFNK